MNALFYDIKMGNVLDLTKHGISDIQNRVIRTPSIPSLIIGSDPVRILRAIRFAASFDNFQIDSQLDQYLKSLDTIKVG